MAGELDVEAMLRRLPAKQFRLWEMYDAIEPFGDYRADARSAQITAMVHNVAVVEQDRKDSSEFMLRWRSEEELEEEKRKKEQDLPRINGVPITEQIWMAMNIAAMNAAGAFDQSKVRETK